MNNRKVWSLVLAVLIAVTALAQNPTSPVLSFTIEAPESAEQGVPFNISYKLVATHWDKWEMIAGGNGVVLSDVHYNISTKEGIHTMDIQATAYTSKTDDVELPRMAIPIDGKLVYSDSRHVHITPNSTCGEEMTAAHHWLVAEGCHPDSVVLQVEERQEELTLLTDAQHQNFVIIANKPYWSLVGNPIMAYSTDNNFVIRKNSGRDYKDILQPFLHQIQVLENSPQPQPAPSYVNCKGSVLPLLGNRRWGQHAPYSLMAPTFQGTGQKAVIGCVPLSMAMVMSAHKWPTEFCTIHPQWTSYQASYDETSTEEEISNLSQLLVTIGETIDASFNSKATPATLNRVKQALCNYAGYSAKVTNLKEPDAETLITLLRRELDAGRPCIVASDSHAFVCDGYRQDFFHFNLGWYGQCNGYYRLLLGTPATAADKSLLWLNTLIFSIEPETHPKTKEVFLTEPGMLGILLSQDEKENTTTLLLHGPLNTDDILLLRKMAGATEEPFNLRSWQGGALRQLDLTDAHIVSDPRPYHSRPATGTWTHYEVIGSQKKKITYDFKNMSEAQWERFKEDIGAERPGLTYTRSDDNRYQVNYHCSDDTIGKYMFAGCSSLNRILLPIRSQKIDDYAFMECSLLQQIRIPAAVQEVGICPFYFCHSLQQIELPQACLTDKKGIAKNCAPDLQITRYKP